MPHFSRTIFCPKPYAPEICKSLRPFHVGNYDVNLHIRWSDLKVMMRFPLKKKIHSWSIILKQCVGIELSDLYEVLSNKNFDLWQVARASGRGSSSSSKSDGKSKEKCSIMWIFFLGCLDICTTVNDLSSFPPATPAPPPPNKLYRVTSIKPSNIINYRDHLL